MSSPCHDAQGTEPIDVAVVPPSRVRRKSQRASYHSSPRGTLTLTQKAAFCSRAGNQTLRELAADVGVSHETVRATPRTVGAADVKGGLAAE